MEHECPACGKPGIPQHLVMDNRCWRKVPAELQRRVYGAWNRGNPKADYLEIRELAVQASKAGRP